MKEIKEIVIYTSTENGTNVKKSCIFYTDGTYEEGNYSDAIKAAKVAAAERNITSKNVLQEMMDKEVFIAMTEKEFKEKYSSYFPESTNAPVGEPLNIPLESPVETLGDENRHAPRSAILESAKYDDVKQDDLPEEVVFEEDYDGDFYIDYTGVEEEQEEVIEEQEENEEENDKFSDKQILITAGVVVVGVILGATLFTCCNRKSKEGEMLNSNLEASNTTTTAMTDEDNYDSVNTVTLTNDEVVEYNNDLYNDYTYAQLLEATQSDFQKTSMINVASSLTGFNNIFAEGYLESGNDIKAALSFDEVVALQQAYNDYSKEQIRAYFNGYEIDAVDMSNAYKSASLQLMGAYVIESSENPVDMSILIDSQEGKDFYAKYHNLFLAAKEATGEEQLALVKEFYDNVRTDFPITEEEKTDGIAHSEDYESIKDYQSAVAPMIAAAEMIFQNLDVDYTLDTIENNISEIDFINDIGLCNLADDKFERIETILLGAYEDNENPLFEQYRNVIINDQINSNSYVIDDAHRELANLLRFQLIVNADDNLIYYSTTYTGTYGAAYTTSYTASSTSSGSTTSTTYSTETTTQDAPIPSDVQANIDAQIAQQNNQAQQDGQNEANNNASTLQAQEDINAQEINSQINNENNQTQNDINDINTTINNGGTVNTNDYPNININTEYTDGNGNLDSSVQGITTDGTGANQPLPDPNVTGAEFDAASSSIPYEVTYYVVEEGYQYQYTK